MRRFLAGATVIAAAATITTIAQIYPPQLRDDAHVSTHDPVITEVGPDVKTKDDPAGRMEWMREVMGGDISPEFVALLLQEAAQQQARYPSLQPGAVKPGAPGTWTNLGPARSDWVQNGVRVTASDTGRLRTILVHPTTPDIVYVLASGGGLWKTTNFSAPRPSWRPISDGVMSTSGGSIAFGGSPQTLYFGVGDPFDRFIGGFVSKSSDGGLTWSAGLKLGASVYVPDVKVDTSTGTDIVLVATNTGLFRSADGGATYSPVPSIGAARIVWSLAQTSAGWLATTQGGTGPALWLSTDAGATWTQVSGSPTDILRTTLAVAAPGDRVVYAFARSSVNGRQRDLFRSADGGLTWTALGLNTKTPLNPNEDQPNMDIMLDQAFYNHMVLVDPNDASRNTVYIGGQLSSAKTTDGGATWTIISNWLAQYGLPYVHADFHCAAMTILNKRPALLFGTDGGLFVSTDGGTQFSSQKNDGISSNLIYAMVSNPKHPDDVLIGLQDDGTRLRVGPTSTFNQVFGGDGFGVGWSQANDAVALGSVYYSFIVRTIGNPPATQNRFYRGWDGIAEFFDPTLTYFHTSIATPTAAADPSGLTFFHRTRFKLYRTTDGADNWTSLLDTSPVLIRPGLHPIGISPDDLDFFGVVTNGGGLRTTTDGGATWTTRVLGPGGIVPGWIGFNSNLAYASNTTLYVASEAPTTETTAARVIKSTDGGATWAFADAGLPRIPVTKIILSTRDPNRQTMYAGTWLGVYETTDGGASWHLFGAGLPLVNVSDLYMPPDGSYLRISTYGRGVWDYRF